MAGGALLDCLEAVERVTGGCLTFWDQEKIRRIGAFPLHSHIAGPGTGILQTATPNP